MHRVKTNYSIVEGDILKSGIFDGNDQFNLTNKKVYEMQKNFLLYIHNLTIILFMLKNSEDEESNDYENIDHEYYYHSSLEKSGNFGMYDKLEALQ